MLLGSPNFGNKYASDMGRGQLRIDSVGTACARTTHATVLLAVQPRAFRLFHKSILSSEDAGQVGS
jgi:hypothetical protein